MFPHFGSRWVVDMDVDVQSWQAWHAHASLSISKADRSFESTRTIDLAGKMR